jgi:hypothetical protein
VACNNLGLLRENIVNGISGLEIFGKDYRVEVRRAFINRITQTDGFTCRYDLVAGIFNPYGTVRFRYCTTFQESDFFKFDIRHIRVTD